MQMEPWNVTVPFLYDFSIIFISCKIPLVFSSNKADLKF